MKHIPKKEKFREEKRKNKLKKKIIFWSLLIIIFSGFGYWVTQSSKNQLNFSNPDVDLNKIPSTQIHWHPKLNIKIEGKSIIIPNNIGIGPGVHSPTHTHDEGDGTIHLENPNPRNTPESMSLGYFFNLWKQPFNETCLLDKCIGVDGGNINMYVNGEQNYDFEKFIYKGDDEIVIEYSN